MSGTKTSRWSLSPLQKKLIRAKALEPVRFIGAIAIWITIGGTAFPKFGVVFYRLRLRSKRHRKRPLPQHFERLFKAVKSEQQTGEDQ